MKIQNVEMEFVTFDAQDILTASGPIPVPTTLNIQKYSNGTSNDLTITFDGVEYKDANSLNNALSGKYGSVFRYYAYDGYYDPSVGINGVADDVFSAAFRDDKKDSGTLYANGNGDYTWDGAISRWLNSNLQ